MEIGYIIGWIGVATGLLVAPPQLYKIIKTRRMNDISLVTYSALCITLVCYLLHAIYIHSAVFTTAQAINLTVNSIIWAMLMRHRFKRGELTKVRRIWNLFLRK